MGNRMVAFRWICENIWYDRRKYGCRPNGTRTTTVGISIETSLATINSNVRRNYRKYIFSVDLYCYVFYSWAKIYFYRENSEKRIGFWRVGLNVGFKNGDKIVSIDGQLQPKFNWAVIDVLLSDEVIVDRNGKRS